MKTPVLVIMAAGMGSRFGSLKQITPVDDEGHKIIDFSLYDARRAGFGKVVFIIKKAIDSQFRQAIGSRMEGQFDVRYVYQELDMLPPGFSVPPDRVKPWGTAHAIACAAPAIDGPFAVLNADDYYGPNALRTIYQFLSQERGPGEHAMVGYRLRNTVTAHGAVSRGICRTEAGFLQDIEERTRIELRGTDIASTEDGETWQSLSGETVVSMNLWGFQQEILPQFTGRFSDFLRDNLERNPLKCEYYLPSVANAQLKEGLGTVQVLPTEDVWHGVTYPEDLKDVQQAMARLKDQGIYPRRLWE